MLKDGCQLFYIKGAGTRYLNILSTNVDNADHFLGYSYEKISLEECKGIRKNVKECIGKLQLYSEKLIQPPDKLTQGMSGEEDKTI